MNDLIRPGFDAAEVAGVLEEMFAALTASGARVATVTFPDIGKIAPPAKRLLPRVLAFNAHIREAAARHGVIVFDSFPYEFATDSRIWSSDRLHASPLGHARIAAGIAHALDLPGSDETWAIPLPPLAPRTFVQKAAIETRWLGGFLLPWIHRRLTGRSSGDGRSAKRPDLTPFVLPAE